MCRTEGAPVARSEPEGPLVSQGASNQRFVSSRFAQILSSWLAVAPTMDRVRNFEMKAGRVSATIS